MAPTDVDRSRDQERAGARARGGGLALGGICLGFVLVLFDATAVNVAAGDIATSLGASVVGVQWVLNAYTVAFAAFMLSSGVLGDRYGARKVYLTGALVFAVASAACALASSVPMLIAARAVQGVGAAAAVPCSLALIAHRFAAGPDRTRALGIWGGVSGIGLAAGPVIGGSLVSVAGWQAVFLVVVPFAFISIVIVATRIEETPRDASRRPDPAGQVLTVVALVALTTALTETATLGWTDPVVVGLLLAALVAGAGFVALERRVLEPMLPPALFRSGSFSGALGIGLLFNFGLYGVLFCLALVLERTLRESAAISGLAILPLAAVVAVGALLSGPLTGRYGPRIPILLGLGGGLVGTTLLALTGNDLGAIGLAVVGAVLGTVGLAMPAMTGVALNAAGTGQAGLAAAALNASRQTGGALGVALLGSTVINHVGASTLSTDLRGPMTLAAAGYLTAIAVTFRTIQRVPPPKQATPT